MFWKKRSSLLQEKTIPPPFGRPAWRNPFSDTPIRPPAGGKNHQYWEDGPVVPFGLFLKYAVTMFLDKTIL